MADHAASACPDCTSSTEKREIKPFYVSSGSDAEDRLAFFHILERLKTQKRTGWIGHKIPSPESISDHMYRMAVLAMCTSDQKLDISKCVMMAIVHDIAEAHVGDITPHEDFSKADKEALEAKAIRNFVHDMLHGSPAALRIEALWKEYEERETPEAKFVKDLDRFELALQASEYERDCSKQLQCFLEPSVPQIKHPEVRMWAKDLMEERGRRNK